MPKSEIDHIFARKGKFKPTTSPPPAKKKKKKKKKDHESKSEVKDQPPTNKRPLPETVVDTSAPVAKRVKTDKHLATKPPTRKARNEGDNKFVDSRGSGSRKTTEEGWAIYKEDELRISNEGGDTPDCPFDCNCCF